MDVQKRIDHLREELRKHNYHYYIQDNPIISDHEYDKLFQELKELEQQHPDLITPDSPTQKLNIHIQKKFAPAEHYSQLLSLDNTYNAEELRDFDKRVKKQLNLEENHEVPYVIEYKYDGAGVAIVYRNGVFERAATRGNGAVGEDISENIKTIPSIPLKLQKDIQFMEIRGEILMSKASFEKLNEARASEGKQLFANPRNAASGSIRQLDPSITAKRRLDVVFYDITAFDDATYHFESHDEEIAFLRSCGLKSTEVHKAKNIEEVIKYAAEVEGKRNDFPYEIDGLVIKVDNVEWKKRLGVTQHHPKSAIAFKFAAQEEITKLHEITVQVGRTGVLTPVAELEPVEIGGVTVSRATLHNMEDLEKKDVRVGDFVLVKRAGDVIPAVVKPIEERRTGKEKKYHPPKECPVCNAHVVQLPEEVAVRCPNLSCPAQIKERLKHFVSKHAMDIDGLGKRHIENFVEHGLVKDFADIYHLKDRQKDLLPLLYVEEKLELLKEKGELQMNLFSEKKQGQDYELKLLHKLLEAIELSKDSEIDRLIVGLGIQYVGRKTAKILKDDINNIWELADKDKETLEELEGIGEKIAESIADYLTQQENITLLKRLEAAGVNFEKKEKKKEVMAGKLTGKTLLFTGSLSQMSRDEASEKAESEGAKVVSAISKSVDYLVVGEKAGSKLEKAKKLGVPVVSEDDFLRMIG